MFNEEEIKDMEEAIATMEDDLNQKYNNEYDL